MIHFHKTSLIPRSTSFPDTDLSGRETWLGCSSTGRRRTHEKTTSFKTLESGELHDIACENELHVIASRKHSNKLRGVQIVG